MEDIEKVLKCCKNIFFLGLLQVIMPGVTHWHHPQFHAYFPTANSYPGIGSTINIPIYILLLSCGHALRRDLLHRFLLAGLPRLH